MITCLRNSKRTGCCDGSSFPALRPLDGSSSEYVIERQVVVLGRFAATSLPLAAAKRTGGWLRHGSEVQEAGGAVASGRALGHTCTEPAECSGASHAVADVAEASTCVDTAASVRPSPATLLLRRPLALLALVPRPAVLFFAGAASGAIGKSLTAPLDRVKILLQVRGGSYEGVLGAAAASGSLIRSFMAIGQVDGLLGYWKGNLPQVLRVLPYSAVQLCSYEMFKRQFADSDGQLSVGLRLAAGACAGMTSTLVTYPLDTLRLRLAVDPAARSMGAASSALYRAGGAQAFFRGLGPALVGIAPYMALELAVFDLLPKDKTPPFVRGFVAALLATGVCYPLDTVRRHIQMQSAGRIGMLAVASRIVRAEGPGGLYRGFLPNALKNLPNKGVRLSTFEAAKKLLDKADGVYQEECGRAVQLAPTRRTCCMALPSPAVENMSAAAARIVE